MTAVPLARLQTELGASFETIDGIEIASAYGSLDDEVAAARQSVALIDLTHRGRLQITGTDRSEFLHGQSTGPFRDLAAGHGIYTTFLNGKGKMRGDGWVWVEPDHLWLTCAAPALAIVRSHLESFVIMEDVTFHDRGPETVELGLVGPEAPARLEARLGLTAPAEGRRITASFADAPIAIAAETRLGVSGVSVTAPLTVAAALWRELVSDVQPCGHRAVEVLRVEAGIPLWGAELDDETIPIEAGLGHAIDYDKGCFTGYEVVARIRTYGHVNRHLRGLVLESDSAAEHGDVVLDGDKRVGVVGTSVVSQAVGAAVALSLVRREVAEPGTALVVDRPGGAVAAHVVELPFTARG